MNCHKTMIKWYIVEQMLQNYKIVIRHRPSKFFGEDMFSTEPDNCFHTKQKPDDVFLDMKNL